MADTERVRRVRHPVVVTLIGLVLVAAVAGSFAVGRFVKAPASDAIRAAQAKIHVWAPVATRVVDSRTTFAGKVDAGDPSVIAVDAPSPAVVVRQTVAVGAEVKPGALLGIVSGQPYWLLSGPLPLYRDLSVGDKGDDVTALQQSLASIGSRVRVTGTVDSTTIAAVRSLYQQKKLPPPAGNTIAYVQFVSAPASDSVAATAAAVGAHLDEKTPLLTLRAATNNVVFRADSITSQSLKVGDPITIQVGAKTLQGVIATIGAYSAGEGDQVPGHDITVSSSDPALSSSPDGAAVTVMGPGSTSKSLSVPVSAIHQNQDGGNYVIQRTKHGSKKTAVTVDRSGAGWAAISHTSIAAGDSVMVE